MNPNFLVNDFLREISLEKGNANPENLHSSPGYPAWNLFYFTLAVTLKRNINNILLETGTYHGVSTIIMAQAMKDFNYKGEIFSIEIRPEFAEIARNNLNKAGLSDYVEILVGDSREVIPELLHRIQRIDFAFLDSGHHFEVVYPEFELIVELVKASREYVYFDNTGEQGVRKTLEEIKKFYGGNILNFPNCSWGPEGQAIWSP